MKTRATRQIMEQKPQSYYAQICGITHRWTLNPPAQIKNNEGKIQTFFPSETNWEVN
jgi:hypothetical protein